MYLWKWIQGQLSEHTFKSKWPDTPLQSSSVKLRTYFNESLQVLGQFEVKAQYNRQTLQLPLIVVKGKGPTLFRRDWLSQIRFDWKNPFHSEMWFNRSTKSSFPCFPRDLRDSSGA